MQEMNFGTHEQIQPKVWQPLIEQNKSETHKALELVAGLGKVQSQTGRCLWLDSQLFPVTGSGWDYYIFNT